MMKEHVFSLLSALAVASAFSGQSSQPGVGVEHSFRSLQAMPSAEGYREGEAMDRRGALSSLFGLTATAFSLLGSPAPASATYGLDAKIEMPNPVQGMSDRVNKQCLMESLGNRECLVYAEDASKFLYKGADGQRLLDRIQASAKSLSDLPPLIESKKWSQVVGVLTGPMGELIRTMNQLVELSEDKALAKSKVNQVKTDLYAITAAVDRKQVDSALKAHSAATVHLVEFAKEVL